MLKCRHFALAVATVALLVAPAYAGPWYQGGTLHKANAGTWQKAPYANRLATAGDFVAKLWQTGNLKGNVKSMDQVKGLATELEACITAAAKDRKLHSQPVADMAMLCIYQLGLSK